jgi:hypothetical protein
MSGIPRSMYEVRLQFHELVTPEEPFSASPQTVRGWTIARSIRRVVSESSTMRMRSFTNRIPIKDRLGENKALEVCRGGHNGSNSVTSRGGLPGGRLRDNRQHPLRRFYRLVGACVSNPHAAVSTSSATVQNQQAAGVYGETI